MFGAANATIQTPWEHTIVSTAQGVEATRYLTVSALTVVLWEHLLTLHLEVHHIWARALDGTKVVFLFNRYTVEAGLLYTVYLQAGFRPQLHESICSHFMYAIWILVLGTVTTTSVDMCYYYYTIWDHRKSILLTLIVSLVVTYIPGIGLGLYSMTAYAADVVYDPLVDQCVLRSQSIPTKVFWACLFAFDVVAITVGVVNSFDRPFQHRNDVIRSLQRDGASWFVGIALLRFFNLVLGIVLPATEVLLLAFNVWGLINVTFTRFILRVEEFKRPRAELVRVWNLQSETFELRPYTVDSA